MGTLKGFPNPPALWLRRAKPAYAYAGTMGTLKGFPNPPALWLRRAKPAYAYAGTMGTLGGFLRWQLRTRLMGTLRGFLRCKRSTRLMGALGGHLVSLCSVCLRQRLQYFDSLSFSALARLFLVLE